MNSRLLLKLLSISLITLILFSCGTSSNGIFEKRKHMRGWHFKSNKVSAFNNSVNQLEPNYSRIHDWAKQEVPIGIGAEDTSVYLPKTSHIAIHDDNGSSVYSKNKNSISMNNNWNRESEFIVEYGNKEEMSNDFTQNAVNGLQGEKDDVENERLLTPFQIFFSIFVSLAFFSATLALVIFGAIFLNYIGFTVAGVIIGTLCVYLLTSLLVFNIARFYKRKDGVEVLTLKQSFIRVGVFLGSIGISLLLFIYFYNM